MVDLDEVDVNSRQLRNQLLTFSVITILILTGVYILIQDDSSSKKIPFQFYENYKADTSASYFIELDSDTSDIWQFQAAVSFIPAILGSNIEGDISFNPLIFSTTPVKPTSIQKYPDLSTSIEISDFGDDANEATIEIARRYWSSINTIILASDYKNALLVSALAAKKNLPIVIDGGQTKGFIKDMNVKSALAIGKINDYQDMIGVKQLDHIQAVWEEFLNAMEEDGEECEYIVITNPEDIDFEDPTIYIPGLSLASGVLAAGHKALLVTGDYSVEQSWIQQLGYGLGDAGSGERGNDDDALTDENETELQIEINTQAIEIDQDIDKAVEYLKSREHDPEFVSVVGGPAAMPMMYLKSPIWYEEVDQEEKGEEYVATDMYYGDLEIKLGERAHDQELEENYYHIKDELYTQELAMGRIVAQDVRDANLLVVKSLGYWNYEFESDIFDPTHWNRNALIITSLMTGDSDNIASRHQQTEFIENRMVPNKYDPNDIAGSSFKIWRNDVTAKMEDVNAIIYDGHGYPDGWYHMWTSTADEEADWDVIGAEDINDLTLHAVPVFGACCLSSALDWPVVGGGGSNEEEMTPDNCMSLAFIHAGAISYIGATEESWGAFFGGLLDENPDAWGTGDFDLPTMFWEYLLEYDLEQGNALNEAKQKFLEKIWTDPASRPFARLCVLETVLYGDPAALNGHPGFSM